MKLLFAPWTFGRYARSRRWGVFFLLLILSARRPAQSFPLTSNVWQLVEVFFQQTHRLLDRLFQHEVTHAPAPILALPAPVAPRPVIKRRAHRKAHVIPSGIRLHNSPSRMIYHIILTGHVSSAEAFPLGTVLNAQVQSGEETASAQTTLRPDGTYELRVPIYSHVYARVDWQLSVQTPQGRRAESAGRYILAPEEQTIRIEVPPELQVAQTP